MPLPSPFNSMRRRGVLAGALAVLGLIALATTMRTPAPETVVLRLGHYASADHPAHTAAMQFAAAVEERSAGRIRVEVFPDNQLGNPPELLEQNIAGMIDMSLPTQGILDKYSRKFAVVMLPFIFRDHDHAHAVLDGPFMNWAGSDLEAHGLVYLANWEWGFRHLTNNRRRIEHASDLAGLRIRTPPEIQLQATVESLGAEVVTISFPRLYAALAAGEVDGQENPLSVIHHNRLYEVQRHLALTRHVYSSMVHVISTRTWARLTPAERAMLREESRRAGQTMRAAIRAEEESLLEQMQAAGMQVTRPPAEDFLPAARLAHARINAYAGNDYVATFLHMVDMGY
ncbi:TRAP transporter substrate-binding protein [Pseudothauera lacus]|uniref:C4-dicarboxylate ABC transporter substrate-binding protein n=1 Tax=Pseudothauera lacus TaxID=2136175 RepID=A0A2T4IK96_9RHOO|nr:TRAP transporter substrate-binding protein [Pseudothauera lacus]PTD98178.1 C4-dicarboxylate ABC transporter substrate-binding protein [Pseudothauera lacus]